MLRPSFIINGRGWRKIDMTYLCQKWVHWEHIQSTKTTDSPCRALAGYLAQKTSDIRLERSNSIGYCCVQGLRRCNFVFVFATTKWQPILLTLSVRACKMGGDESEHVKTGMISRLQNSLSSDSFKKNFAVLNKPRPTLWYISPLWNPVACWFQLTHKNTQVVQERIILPTLSSPSSASLLFLSSILFFFLNRLICLWCRTSRRYLRTKTSSGFSSKPKSHNKYPKTQNARIDGTKAMLFNVKEYPLYLAFMRRSSSP